jgi:hypothetical protein
MKATQSTKAKESNKTSSISISDSKLKNQKNTKSVSLKKAAKTTNVNTTLPKSTTKTIKEAPVKKKGILKKNRSFRANESRQLNTNKKKSKGATLNPKANLFQQFLRNFGFTIGKVVLSDPRAIEAADALDLKQWHIQKLKASFDAIDIDGSGNIDFDEFFASIGEVRSPFTDKLFAIIGKLK